MLRVLGVLLFASAGAANAADQFDLVCTGSTQATGEFHHEPISRRYHVDLGTKQWCYNECTVRPIAEVNSGQIVFERTKAAYQNDPSESLDYVDRTTGKWAFFAHFWQGDGTCQLAPFTGFPAPPTKF